MPAVERLSELAEVSGRASRAGSAILALRFALENRRLEADQEQSLAEMADFFENVAAQAEPHQVGRGHVLKPSTLREVRAVEDSVARGQESSPVQVLRDAAKSLRSIKEGAKLPPEEIRAVLSTVERVGRQALTAARSIRGGR